MRNLTRLACGVAATAAMILAGCASAPNNDAARAKAQAGYNNADSELAAEFGAEEVKAPAGLQNADGSLAGNPRAEEPAPSIVLSTATFKTRPTVLVTPAMTGKMMASIDVIRNNPLAKTAMEVINGYMTSRDYSVVGLESQAQLDEVVQLQADIAGNDEDLAYVAGLSVGADINISYAGSIQNGHIVIDLNATEASTANLLASESVRLKDEGEGQRVLVQKAVQQAIVLLENKVRDRLAADMEKGVQYKVVARLTGDFTDDQAEEISNMVSLQIRKKFNKMQVLSMTRNTYDLLVFADADQYEDAQMVYGAFVEGLNGLAKVRKQNITKKLIILEIQ